MLAFLLGGALLVVMFAGQRRGEMRQMPPRTCHSNKSDTTGGYLYSDGRSARVSDDSGALSAESPPWLCGRSGYGATDANPHGHEQSAQDLL